MKKYNTCKLPTWLDEIVFEKFEATYEPRPDDVVYNPDQPHEFVKIYLGTYFPRSYAEAYGIANSLLSIDKYNNSLQNLEEINILDIFCGTGGEILGLIVALNENLPNLKRVNIDAYDANIDAILFLYHLVDAIGSVPNISLEININPQCIYVETEQNIQDIVNCSNVNYHFILSFKAINEFVQHRTFNERNPYELIASYFLPLLDSHGVFIMSDVTTKSDQDMQYYPQIMNDGINKYLRKTQGYKSIVPNACFAYEGHCPGCYMQDVFYVSHSKKFNDVSKIAYRIICNKDFAQKILSISPSKQCKANNPLADKHLPYN